MKITDAQADVWKAYAEAIKARVERHAEHAHCMMDAMDKGEPNDGWISASRVWRLWSNFMKAVKPATDKLYAALTAEQKKIADQLIGVDCGAM